MPKDDRIDLMNRKYLSVKEFAHLIDVHYNTVLRSIRSGRLNAFRVSEGRKGCYRIPITEIHRISLYDLEDMVQKIVKNEMQK